MPSFDLTGGELALLAIILMLILLPSQLPALARLLSRGKGRPGGANERNGQDGKNRPAGARGEEASAP